MAKKILKQGGMAMKRKKFEISVLAIVFFVVSGIPALAQERGAESTDLRKAVAACEYKVRQLERKVIALDSNRSGSQRKAGIVADACSRDAEGAYGSAYWGYLLDN
jgi:hypothetical protein